MDWNRCFLLRGFACENVQLILFTEKKQDFQNKNTLYMKFYYRILIYILSKRWKSKIFSIMIRWVFSHFDTVTDIPIIQWNISLSLFFIFTYNMHSLVRKLKQLVRSSFLGLKKYCKLKVDSNLLRFYNDSSVIHFLSQYFHILKPFLFFFFRSTTSITHAQLLLINLTFWNIKQQLKVSFWKG